MTSLKLTLLAAAITVASSAHAGVNDDLGSFFDGLNYSSNMTSSSAYEGQSANHYSGGSAFIRTPIRQEQLIGFTPPSISAGCGGIDLFAGGFSHINSDALIALGKNVVSSAIPFAVDLALQTWAPMIKNIKDRLESIAKDINALSINSCEAAQVGVSALAGFADVGSNKYICETMGNVNNTFSDWAAAKNGCNDKAEVDKQVDNAGKNDELKKIIQANRNIIWHSIMTNDFLKADPELAEFFMSLSGTIIYDAKTVAHRKPSLLEGNNNMIKVLLDGGKTDIYRCNDRAVDKCLIVTKQTVTFDKDKAFKRKVFDILTAIATQYANDLSTTDEQKAFLESVSLPVLKMMSVSLESGIPPQLEAYSSVIASDFVTDYLMQVLALIKASIRSEGNNERDLDKLYAVIERSSSELRLLRFEALQILNQEQAIIGASMNIEKRIEGSFSAQARANLLFNSKE